MKNKILLSLVFLYFAFFSFGQLPAFLVQLIARTQVNIHITDLVLLTLLLFSLKNIVKMKFLLVIAFSTLFSLTFLTWREVLIGILYLVRIISIINLGLVLRGLVATGYFRREMLILTLLINVFAIAVWGWIQYLLIPDTRQMYILGWDDHYYRLIGTFFDPAFTGILLVLGSLLSLHRFIVKKERAYMLLFSFLTITTLFTYSRASFLALVGGVIVMLFKKISIKTALVSLSIFTLSMIALPRPGGEGVKLERLYTFALKAQNFKEGITLFAESPVFGVGFNNVCAAQKYFFQIQPSSRSHSCNGLDNSLVFLLATVGIVGVIKIVLSAGVLLREISTSKKKIILYSSLIAVAIHGIFTNTWVYPWVFGWIATLYVYLYEVKERSER